jgi:hypothetical protein
MKKLPFLSFAVLFSFGGYARVMAASWLLVIDYCLKLIFRFIFQEFIIDIRHSNHLTPAPLLKARGNNLNRIIHDNFILLPLAFRKGIKG